MLQADLTDTEAQLVQLPLIRGEPAICRKGGGDVGVVIRVIRAGVQDDEVPIFQSAIVPVVVTPGMVFSRHDDGFVGQSLSAFSFRNELEESSQGPLGHAYLRTADELQVRLDPNPGCLPHQGHLRRRLDLPQNLDGAETISDLYPGVLFLQSFHQLKFSGEPAIKGVLRHDSLERAKNLVGVHAGKLFRPMGEVEHAVLLGQLRKKRLHFFNRPGRFEPGVLLRAQYQLGRNALPTGVMFTYDADVGTAPIEFRFNPVKDIVGRVVTRVTTKKKTFDTGKPDRRVQLLDFRAENPVVLAETETDGDGNFSFPGLLPGVYTVRLVKKHGKKTETIFEQVRLVLGDIDPAPVTFAFEVPQGK